MTRHPPLDPLTLPPRRGRPHRRVVPGRRFALALGGVLAVALVVAPRIARAQEPSGSAARLTLDELVRDALATHPSLGAQRAAYEETRAAAKVAGASRLPRLDAAASATRYQEPMLVQPLHGLDLGRPVAFDETLLQGGVTASYMVFDGGARGARIRQARARVGAAEANLDESQLLLIRQTTGAYADLLARGAVVDAHEARVRALEAERARVERLEAVGRAARVERLRAEAAFSSAVADRVRAQASLDVAVRDLARLSGRDPAALRPERIAPVLLADSTLVDREVQLAATRASNTTVARAGAQLAAASAAVDVARGARLPEVRLLGAQLGRGSANHAMKAEWSLGGMVSVPLFTGGANASEVARASAAHRMAAEQLRLAELQAAQELDRARATVAEADARAASLRDAMERFTEVARVERLSLDTGAGTQTDYLQAEAELLAARAGHAEARAAQLSARAELARVVGELSPAWLHRTVEVAP